MKEIEAAKHADHAQGIVDFDRALFGHVKFALSNLARALVMGVTGSHFVRAPDAIDPKTRRYYQQLTRMSASFAFVSDVSMLVLGGALKRREKLSARLGDVLCVAWLLCRIVYPLGRMFEAPSDEIGARAARILLEPSSVDNMVRDRLTAGVYLPADENDPVGALEAALPAAIAAEHVENRIRQAVRDGRIRAQAHAEQVCAMRSPPA